MARKDISDAQVLQVYLDERSGIGRVALLMDRTGQPEKVCYRAMERAGDRGYIEYGVSLRSGWLTDAGKALAGSAPPASATPAWPAIIVLDLASKSDETVVGAWDLALRGFIEGVSGRPLQEWQSRFLCREVVNTRIPPNTLNSIAPPKEQA